MSAGDWARARGSQRFSPGVVTIVLTIAMIASIVNTFLEITPKSNPTLMMMSSINALVFINIPSTFASA